MFTLFRGRPRAALTLLFLALPVVIGATCQPVKKTPPPTQVAPAPPGEQPDPCAASTVVINAAQLCGWLIQPDAGNATEGGFSSEQASIGTGSLKGGPIGSTPAEKFIAVKGLGIPVSDVVSIGYDFLITGNGTTNSSEQFYLNVYANIDDSDNFYDCRFDYSPPDGPVGAFRNVSFAAADDATFVAKRGTRITTACPAALEDMPAGSFVRAFALNIGDTSASDQGLAGYYDNVKVTTNAGTTTYDFEA